MSHTTMHPEISALSQKCGLGEGPHWDCETQSLYFVDNVHKNIIRYHPETDKFFKAYVGPKQPSFIIPITDKKDKFVVSLSNELVVISWDGKSEETSIEQILCTITEGIKFNDGKCDDLGRLWVGTYKKVERVEDYQPCGVLYSYDSRNFLQPHVDKILISNGLSFNESSKKMYFVDSLKRSVDQFDFDLTNGTITNRQAIFTFKQHNIRGYPDGMTIDSDGNLWVAVFDGSQIIKISGSQTEVLLDTIKMPAVQVASLTFGGPNLDELFVTTGAMEFQGEKQESSADGVVYKISNTGARGFPKKEGNKRISVVMSGKERFLLSLSAFNKQA